MCENCDAAIQMCTEEVAARLSMGQGDIMSGRILIDLSDDEAATMLAHDRGLLCGWC